MTPHILICQYNTAAMQMMIRMSINMSMKWDISLTKGVRNCLKYFCNTNVYYLKLVKKKKRSHWYVILCSIFQEMHTCAYFQGDIIEMNCYKQTIYR